MDILFGPVILFLAIYCRKNINYVHWGIYSEIFTEILFVIVKNIERNMYYLNVIRGILFKT